MLLKTLHAKRFNSSGTYTSDVLNYLYEFGITEFLFISLPSSVFEKMPLTGLNLRAKFLGSVISGFLPWNAKEDAEVGHGIEFTDAIPYNDSEKMLKLEARLQGTNKSI